MHDIAFPQDTPDGFASVREKKLDTVTGCTGTNPAKIFVTRKGFK